MYTRLFIFGKTVWGIWQILYKNQPIFVVYLLCNVQKLHQLFVVMPYIKISNFLGFHDFHFLFIFPIYTLIQHYTAIRHQRVMCKKVADLYFSSIEFQLLDSKIHDKRPAKNKRSLRKISQKMTISFVIVSLKA